MSNYRKVSTRFMDANQDVNNIIFDALTDKYSMSEVCNHEFDYCDALFSNGFVSAVSDGRLPILGTEQLSFVAKKKGEYHHVIFNDECYVVYFDGEE